MVTEIAKPKVQTMRISDAEVSVLKNTFFENDELLNTMRKVMFFMVLNPEDVKMLKVLDNNAVQQVLSKLFIPTLASDVPFGQNIDLWMTLKLDDKDDSQILNQLLGREKMLGWLEKGLAGLTEIDAQGNDEIVGYKPNLSVKSEVSEIVSTLIARNTYVAFVEAQLTQIRTLAAKKEETEEERAARLKKESSK